MVERLAYARALAHSRPDPRCGEYAMTTTFQETDWLARLKDWLKQRPVMAVIVEVDAQTGRVHRVRTETVETAAALLDTLSLQLQDDAKEE